MSLSGRPHPAEQDEQDGGVGRRPPRASNGIITRSRVVEAGAGALVMLLAVGFLGSLLGVPVSAGRGMAASLSPDTRLWVKGGGVQPQRGDIVVVSPHPAWEGAGIDEAGTLMRGLRWLRLADPPSNARMVTRIVGVPGDEVRCCGSDGAVTVNGQRVPIPVAKGYAFRVVLGPDHYFVSSDVPSAASSQCYLSALGTGALVSRRQMAGVAVASGAPWRTAHLRAGAAPYTGLSMAPLPPQSIVEAAKDPVC